MHAVQYHATGDVNQLFYEEVPMPEPQAGEVRVKVAATGLNFIEIYERKGLYSRQMPYIPGSEFAGVVDKVGPGVNTFAPGDRVVTMNGKGGYADYALAPAAKVVPLPEPISFEVGAAILLQGLTAHSLALSVFPLKPGSTALIHAAAGGVGQLLVRIAKMCNARVLATVSTEEKATLAREAGADEVILYSQVDFETEVKRLTGDQGVDVVYDGVGKTTFAKGLNCLKPRGYMVLFGQASGPVEPVNPQILNQKGSLFLTRPTTNHYILTREELLWRTGDLFTWLASGELQLRIDRTFPLAEAGAAQTYMENRETKGKVLLVP